MHVGVNALCKFEENYKFSMFRSPTNYNPLVEFSGSVDMQF
jgi:hypothetical protein